jgi:hypothetical protein
MYIKFQDILPNDINKNLLYSCMQTLDRADRKLKIAFESCCQKETEYELVLDSYQE